MVATQQVDRNGLAYRAQVLSRTVAAVVGGYLFSMAAAAALTCVLPLPLGEALMTAAMASYVVYLLAILWVFSTGSPGRAWAGMVLGTCALAAFAWVMHSALLSTSRP